MDLSHNLLNALPATIGYCLVLQDLNLAGNQLRALPTEVAACRSLRTLNLRGNRLGSEPPPTEPVEVGAKVRVPRGLFADGDAASTIGSLAEGSWEPARGDDGGGSVQSHSRGDHDGDGRHPARERAPHHSPVVPSALSVLPCLRWLDISFNEARLLTPELGLCPGLTFVNASHNLFTDVSSTFCHSSSIVMLDLSFNRLERISDEVGRHMRALETLDVSCNLLERLPDSLGRCATLRHVFASGNRLVNVPSTLGPVMTVLQTFDVSNNPMVRRHADNVLHWFAFRCGRAQWMRFRCARPHR